MVWNEPAPARRDGAAHGCYFPKPADIVFDRDIIRWIGEDHLGLFAIEEIGNYSGIECIAADKAVRSKPPEIAGLAPRWDGFRLRKVGHPPGHPTPMQLHGHDAESVHLRSVREAYLDSLVVDAGLITDPQLTYFAKIVSKLHLEYSRWARNSGDRDDDVTRVRVICEIFQGRHGPVEGVAADPRYLDIFVLPGRRKTLPVETERHAFAYVFEGSGTFSSASQPFGVLTERVGDRGGTPIRERAGNRSLVLFDSGDEVTVQAGEEGMRFPLVSGKPLEEPVAWHGPIVMNTESELEQAYACVTGRSSSNVTNDGKLRLNREDGRMR